LAKAGPVFRPQIAIRLEAVAVAGLDVRLILAVAEKLELGRLLDPANRSGGHAGLVQGSFSSRLRSLRYCKAKTCNQMNHLQSMAVNSLAAVAFSSPLLPYDHEKRFVRRGSNPVRERRDRTNEFITDFSRSSIPDDCMNRFLTFAGRFLARFQTRYAASSHITVSGPDPVFLGAALATEARTRSVSG
jgi:hypothetical protein